jgi:hypothetical protein
MAKERFTLHGPMINGRYRVRDERTCAQTDFDDLGQAIQYQEHMNKIKPR